MDQAGAAREDIACVLDRLDIAVAEVLDKAETVLAEVVVGERPADRPEGRIAQELETIAAGKSGINRRLS